MKPTYRQRMLRAALLCLFAAGIVVILADKACPDTLGDSLVITAAVADLASTKVALARGGQEINTVSSLKGQAALHAVVAGGAIALAHEADKGGHKGWGRVLRIAPTVIFGGAAAWNLTRGGK